MIIEGSGDGDRGEASSKAIGFASPHPARLRRVALSLKGRGTLIGIIIFVIIAILLVGLLFKVLKIAIIVALLVGGVMLFKTKFGPKRLK